MPVRCGEEKHAGSVVLSLPVDAKIRDRPFLEKRNSLTRGNWNSAPETSSRATSVVPASSFFSVSSAGASVCGSVFAPDLPESDFAVSLKSWYAIHPAPSPEV